MLKKNLTLALLSSFLMWLAWPPNTYFAPLLLVGLVPLFVALNRIVLSGETKKGKKIFFTAGLTFFVFNTACVYWIYNAISAYNDTLVALLISFLPFCFGALLMTLAFWLYYQISKITPSIFIKYLGLISFYIGLEYFYQSWDAEFPWMTLGNGFASMHSVIQWYEYTGVYGGSLWILLSNIIAFEAYKKYTSSAVGYAKIRPAILWLLIVCVPIGFS
ncbi:MAG: apolipoprotein N-acyltransferase, partial [Sphingobacteriaceae bacterium]|nr:apolipoprotein N-acyltransferase [Sphingobacteriaceae bacterium]